MITILKLKKEKIQIGLWKITLKFHKVNIDLALIHILNSKPIAIY